MYAYVFAFLVGCAYANDPYNDPHQYEQQEVQQFKSIKGGPGGNFQYNPTYNFDQRFRNNTLQIENMRHNLTAPVNLEVGVCYIEVPTASIVKDPAHVPAGNGSSPDKSRIRSCCRGYIRNIHNYKKCDPVCTHECVNALCTAPETCTCFPDHVKNLAGFCIPTCPIGCQNGHCSGGECLCKEGYHIDSESKFCMPKCKEGCSGKGNCTEPNLCICQEGYQSTPYGACKPVCNQCTNGECVAPNDCRCRPGYKKDQKGLCAPDCPAGFQATPEGCKPICGMCTNGDCVAPNHCQCHAGYSIDHNHSGQCMPQCNPSCENGVCTAPNTCTCKAGYAKNNEGECEPQCTPSCGPNVPCVAPNVCATPTNPQNPQGSPYYQQYPQNPQNNSQNQQYNPQNPQYNPQNPQYNPQNPQYNTQNPQYNPQNPQYNTQNPQYNPQNPQYVSPQNPQNPHLQPESIVSGSSNCLNGQFVAQENRCQCNNGYVLDNSNPTLCRPYCPGGCVNGVCSAPNFCICNMGYYKDHGVKGRPTCVKRLRRSIEDVKPLNVAELLTFEIPAY